MVHETYKGNIHDLENMALALVEDFRELYKKDCFEEAYQKAMVFDSVLYAKGMDIAKIEYD